MREARVYVNVTAAKAGVREAIHVNADDAGALNPAEAAQLGAAISAAAEIVNQLCPPLSIERGMSTPPAQAARRFGNTTAVDAERCTRAGHCVRAEEVCSIDAKHGDHQSYCCSCGENLPVVPS